MARAIAQSDEGRASRRQRKKVEMLFAHLKRILKLDRLRLRGPNGARDELHLAATAQTSGSSRSCFRQCRQCQRGEATPLSTPLAASSLRRPDRLKIYFFNGIDP